MDLSERKATAVPRQRSLEAMAGHGPQVLRQSDAPLRLLHHMRQVETNVYHYSAAMSSCSRRRDWPAAMSLLAELPQRRLAADLVVSNAGVNALARGGWAPALRLLRSLESVRRDAISFLERI